MILYSPGNFHLSDVFNRHVENDKGSTAHRRPMLHEVAP